MLGPSHAREIALPPGSFEPDFDADGNIIGISLMTSGPHVEQMLYRMNQQGWPWAGPGELEQILERARDWRRIFPLERLPTGNYDHPVGPEAMEVYWSGGLTGSGTCFLCDVQWSFSGSDRATCWCCGRSQDRPSGLYG